MSKQYDTAIVFGRFEPFHNEHAKLLQHAASVAQHVIVVIGSANRPRSPKNPFTVDERALMLQQWCTTPGGVWSRDDAEFVFVGADDYLYSNQIWAEEVQRTIDAVHQRYNKVDPKVAVVGCLKDESSFYLKMFPQWDLIELAYEEKVDATQIRDIIFSGKSLTFLEGVVPSTTMEFIKKFVSTEEYQYVKAEREMIAKYKKAWQAAPYAPTFVTADAVVIQSGHILLVRRKAAPGKNLLALPGGFLNQNETIEQAIIRELREETKIKVPAPVLQGSLREIKVFDAPSRSSRGRTITHAGLITLTGNVLPKVKGSDDAAHAGWYPLGSLDAREFFEDHADIINYFKGRI